MFIQLQKVRAEIAELSKNPQGLLLERIHSAGYSGALKNPLLASEEALDRLNGNILEEFVAVRLFKYLIDLFPVYFSLIVFLPSLLLRKPLITEYV